RPFDGDHVLVAQLARGRLKRLAGLGLEDDLGDPEAVADVDEDQPTEVAPGVDPAVEDDGLTLVLGPQLTTGMGPFQHGRRGVGNRSGRGRWLGFGVAARGGFTLPRSVGNRQGLPGSDKGPAVRFARSKSLPPDGRVPW